MKVAVLPNLTKQAALECTEETVRILQECGCETVLKTDLFTEHGVYRQCSEAEDLLRGCDVFVAISGDGTIIHTAKLAAFLDKPVLGVNAGTLGFTAGLERQELHRLTQLAQGDYREEPRRMLSVGVQKGEEVKHFFALNDAVLSGEPAKIIDYRMRLGKRSYRYRADGFIVATPTGSTAYSLSAGGPVIEPSIDCLVYTPICPHSLFNRSVIFAGCPPLQVEIPGNIGKLFLAVDGEPPLEIAEGDRLAFSRADRFARFIRLGKQDFYDTLHRKIIETRP